MTGAETRPDVPLRDRQELADLNPGISEGDLVRLQLWAQLLDEDDAATGYREPGEDDPFSPEDREQLQVEAEGLGVTPELVVQRLGTIEDPDGLWRDREAGE
jgi:hypothetical protein